MFLKSVPSQRQLLDRSVTLMERKSILQLWEGDEPAKVFINLEYGWAYFSNNYYKDGFMDTLNLGIGFKF